MLKERIKWWLFVLLVEAIIWLVIWYYIHHNYLNLTKEISKTEDIVYKDINMSWNIYSWNTVFSITWNNIKYNWMFWNIYIKHLITWSNSFDYKDINSTKISIWIEKFRKYQYFKYLLDQRVIDIYIYEYFVNKDINEFYIFYKNLSIISKYLEKPIYLIDISVVNDKIKKLNDFIDNRNYIQAIKYLIDFENELKSINTNSQYRNMVINTDFYNDEEFKYLINRFVIDKENYYSWYVVETANIFSLDPNLIRASILTEQIRSFYTYRWYIKDIIKTNRLLMVMSQFSYWIWWIKLDTASRIEKQLSIKYPDIYKKYFEFAQDPSVDISNGSKYSSLLDNYFMQIMYVWWLLRNIIDRRGEQWIDITNNPWVIITLYNFWNAENKKPHNNPSIWWAVIKIKDKDYSFGALWTIIYYYLEIYLKTK